MLEYVPVRLAGSFSIETNEFPIPLLALVWNNLGVRPLRSTLERGGYVVQVFLILFIVGFTTGMLSDWRDAPGRRGRRHHRAAAELLDIFSRFRAR